MVIENRPGATGNIGTTLVARATPDGHTLFYTLPNFTITPAVHGNAPYSLKDFTGISQIGISTNAFVVSSALNVKSVSDLIALAQRFDELLQKAVVKRLPKGGASAVCYLSGGVDSGVVTALTAKALGQAPPTFSVRINDARLSDVPTFKPGFVQDMRRVFDDKDIDAIVIAAPNHWHALATIWGLQAGTIDPKPGLHAVEMFRALDRGELKAMWIQVTNPFVTMPNLARFRAGRRARPGDCFLVVSDVYPTPTTALADLVLPSALWVEKAGAFGNSERRTQQWFKMVEPPGQARDDVWQMLAVARKLFDLGFPGMKDRDGKFLGHCWNTPDYRNGRPSGLSIDRDGNVLIAI